MYRDRASKLPDVTDEMWKEVNDDYTLLVDEYLAVENHSPQTKKQYRSGLRQFGWYLYNSMNNKPLYKVTKRDFLRYMSYLRDDRKLSSSSLKFKKSAVSSLNNYIENTVADDDDNYKSFRNFVRGLPSIPKNQVYKKEKISRSEYEEMMEVLRNDENYLGMAWLAVAFNTGARKSEIIQFKTEILDYDFPEENTFIYSHDIRLKGRSEDGKIDSYMINREAFDYMKMWADKRGYNHEYIFTTGNVDSPNQMSSQWANHLCTEVLSDILGRRINPHLFKASCVTHLLEEGIPLELVSRYVAHHESVATTIAHYDLRDFEEEKNKIFK